MNWPWTKNNYTNLMEELNARKQKADDNPETLIEIKDVEDFLDSLKDYKPSIFDRFKWWLNDVSWDIYRYFKPCHQQIRKAIPNRFTDICELIRDVNFEFVKSFHDNEMDIIDWDADDQHKEFKNWINKSYEYITIERPELQDQLSKSYPPPRAKGSYQEKYAEVIRLESLIETKDSELLLEIIKRRQMFWS
jgi:hypothetical protein